MFAETLLEFFECCQMIVYARTLDCLRYFENAARFPIILILILFDLVSISIIYKPYLFIPNLKYVCIRIKIHQRKDFFEGMTHRFDSIFCEQLRFYNFLIDYISFAVINEE